MPHATIIPKYIDPPQGQGKSWKVKDANGDVWYVPAQMAKTMSQGQVAVVEYTENTYNNKTYNIVKAFYEPPKQANKAASAGGGTATEENMFLMGVVGRAMGSGKFDMWDIPLLLYMARVSWQGKLDDYAKHSISSKVNIAPVADSTGRTSSTPSPSQSDPDHAPDFDDEIPF